MKFICGFQYVRKYGERFVSHFIVKANTWNQGKHGQRINAVYIIKLLFCEILN